MSLTLNEHYAASAACFVGGVLSVVTHLWMLFDFFPKIQMCRALRSLHVQLAIANLMVVAFFFIGAVSHFERGWIFGGLFCKFYIGWCKSTPILATGLLAACLFAEYQHATDPSVKEKDEPYRWSSLLAWSNALLWGILALTWANYGQDPASFVCTVKWYEVQPYVTWMSTVGFGLPMLIAGYYAFSLWSKGLLIDNPMAKAAVGLFITMNIQFGAYASGYLIVCCGYTLSIHVLAFCQVWMKSLGVVHPFVYSNMLAADDSEPAPSKTD